MSVQWNNMEIVGVVFLRSYPMYLFYNASNSNLVILPSEQVPIDRQIDYLYVFEPMARLASGSTLQNFMNWRSVLLRDEANGDSSWMFDSDDDTPVATATLPIQVSTSLSTPLIPYSIPPADFSSDSNATYDFSSDTDYVGSEISDMDAYMYAHRYDSVGSLPTIPTVSPYSVGPSVFHDVANVVFNSINDDSTNSEDWRP